MALKKSVTRNRIGTSNAETQHRRMFESRFLKKNAHLQFERFQSGDMLFTSHEELTKLNVTKCFTFCFYLPFIYFLTLDPFGVVQLWPFVDLLVLGSTQTRGPRMSLLYHEFMFRFMNIFIYIYI